MNDIKKPSEKTLKNFEDFMAKASVYFNFPQEEINEYHGGELGIEVENSKKERLIVLIDDYKIYWSFRDEHNQVQKGNAGICEGLPPPVTDALGLFHNCD